MSPVFLCFSLIFITTLSSSYAFTTTLKLIPNQNPKPITNRYDHISSITKSSLARAHHLKTPSSVLTKTTKTPLYPRSYGGYSISLDFGSPPQPVPLVFDTGSSLVWVPCTSHYTCFNCTFSGINPTNISTFQPKLSSTTRVIGCRNPKCGLLFGSDPKTRCSNCPELKNCTQPCPTYFLQYGLGSTAGLAISDSLDLPGRVIPGFLFGCSLLSSRQPQGIAGFGRAPTSLPSQLKLAKFSYCLISHKFDDTPKSSNLTLMGKHAGDKISGVRYTPLGKNPGVSPYDEYYYVHLSKITIGEKRVKLPNKFLKPDPNGHGGVIVDSGTTLTFMDKPVFDPLVETLVSQIRFLKRVRDVEDQTGFGLCYNGSVINRTVLFPEMVFHFKGGAKLKLPLGNYFSFVDERGSLCLTIVSGSDPVGPSVPAGPGVILGNYLQQNFYVEYDLKHQKFGFKKQKCG